MPIYQAYNGRIKAWVKYSLYSGKSKILKVKGREPMKPFKGIPKRGNKK